MIKSFYLKPAFQVGGLQEIVNKVVTKLKRHTDHFDTIVCRGTSGLLIAPSVSMILRKNLLVVRKNDGNHYGGIVEGNTSGTSYVIIDDFISTGNTIRTIKESITNMTCYGICLYLTHCDNIGEYQSILKGIWKDGVKLFSVLRRRT